MNDVWTHFTREVKPTKDYRDMRNALSCIAQELKRFYTPEVIEIYSTPREVRSDEIYEKLNMVKSKLSCKNKQIKKLRNNFKTACVVARSVMSAKENETACFSHHIQLSRKHCESLLQKNRLHSKIIEDLKCEGQFLKDEMDVIENIINLGYTELQKMRSVSIEDVSIMEKLKEIIVCCGKYYSDYYSEHEKRLELERRNRFLTDQKVFLTNTLQGISEELDTMRIQKTRLETENESLKIKQNNAKAQEECGRSYALVSKMRSSCDDPKCKNKSANLNFSSHLTIIKKLLDDQDDMLKCLNKISEELTIQEHF